MVNNRFLHDLKKLQQLEGVHTIAQQLQTLLRQGSLGNSFAAMLMHRHIDLKIGEKLVELNSIFKPWIVDENDAKLGDL